MSGKLYGIGIGPGDPQLLTLRAYKLLSQAQVIAVPVKKAGRGKHCSKYHPTGGGSEG